MVTDREIIFGAHAADKDENKGMALLLKALENLDIPSDEVELHIYGINQDIHKLGKYKIKTYSTLKRDELYQKISQSNVCIVPSKYESFSLASLEAILCNTPVVGFDSSGLKDIIRHRENGYLAKSFDPIDLANGINEVYQGKIKFNNQVEKEKFDINQVRNKFITLYRATKTKITID